MQNTAEKVCQTWNFTYSYGWDFPLLAMHAARLGNFEKAIDFYYTPPMSLMTLDTRLEEPEFPPHICLVLLAYYGPLQC